jgi:hypothetical protein
VTYVVSMPDPAAVVKPAFDSFAWRAGNTIVSVLARAGIGPIHLLTRDYAVGEVGADEAGAVLKRYVSVATKTRQQFQAAKDSPVEDFVAEADRHPVFELIPPPST